MLAGGEIRFHECAEELGFSANGSVAKIRVDSCPFAVGNEAFSVRADGGEQLPNLSLAIATGDPWPRNLVTPLT